MEGFQLLPLKNINNLLTATTTAEASQLKCWGFPSYSDNGVQLGYKRLQYFEPTWNRVTTLPKQLTWSGSRVVFPLDADIIGKQEH